MRRWIVVIDDPQSEVDSMAAAEAYFDALLADLPPPLRLNCVVRGGILAERIVGELVPVRHARMGRGRE